MATSIVVSGELSIRCSYQPNDSPTDPGLIGSFIIPKRHPHKHLQRGGVGNRPLIFGSFLPSELCGPDATVPEATVPKPTTTVCTAFRHGELQPVETVNAIIERLSTTARDSFDQHLLKAFNEYHDAEKDNSALSAGSRYIMPVTRDTTEYLVVELRTALQSNIDGVNLTNASSNVLAHATLHRPYNNKINSALHFKKESDTRILLAADVSMCATCTCIDHACQDLRYFLNIRSVFLNNVGTHEYRDAIWRKFEAILGYIRLMDINPSEFPDTDANIRRELKKLTEHKCRGHRVRDVRNFEVNPKIYE